MAQQKKQKKINNRYDPYEIQSVFAQSIDQYLSKSYPPVRKSFYLKCLIGPLLAINAYLSHWGPWKWPTNYNFLIFSIIFFYVGSYIYEKLDAVSKSDGAMIGQFDVKGTNLKYLIRTSKTKLQYILQQVDSTSSEILRKKSFNYPDYFTTSGSFLSETFHKNLGGFLKSK